MRWVEYRFRLRVWRAFAVVSLLGAGLALPMGAFAKDAIKKTARVGVAGPHLTVSLGFRELFGESLLAKLDSGFPTNVVMRVVLYQEDGKVVAANSMNRVRAVYDLWDGHYLLKFEDWRGIRHEKWPKRSDVVDRLTSLWRFPLSSVEQLSSKQRYFVAVLAEVNPLNEETVAEVRRWLRKPARRQRIGSESFFGSFVSIFVNDRIAHGEKSLLLRSQVFALPTDATERARE